MVRLFGTWEFYRHGIVSSMLAYAYFHKLSAKKRADILHLLYLGRKALKFWLRILGTDLALAASSSDKLEYLRGTPMHEWVSLFYRYPKVALTHVKNAF